MSPNTWQSGLSRDAVIVTDAHSTERASLAAVWKDLVSGAARVWDSFCTDDRCYAVLTGATEGPRLRMTERRLRCLERFLLGEQPKVVADELAISRSTIAMELGGSLDAMGIGRHTSRVPVLLAMAVRASRGDLKVAWGRTSQLEYLGVPYTVVSVARPDLSLAERLSPAECSVARLLLEGRSHHEIATLRRTSVRTIANQLAATFHKLGVSGRSQLVNYVLGSPADFTT